MESVNLEMYHKLNKVLPVFYRSAKNDPVNKKDLVITKKRIKLKVLEKDDKISGGKIILYH